MQLLGASTAFLHINIHPIQQQVPSEKEKKSRGKKCLYEFRIYLRSWNDCLLALLFACWWWQHFYLYRSHSTSSSSSSYLQIHFFVSAFSLLNAWMKSSLHSLLCIWISALRCEHKKENETFTFLACCFCSLHPSLFLSLASTMNEEECWIRNHWNV